MDTRSIEQLKTQLHQLNELHASGVLGDTQFAEARALLEKRIVDAVLQGAPPAPVSTIPANPPEIPAPSTATSPDRHPHRRVWVGVATLTLVVAIGGYAWKGSPQGMGWGSPAAPADPAASSAPHATDNQQMAAMVERLAARLQKDPSDGNGWGMLARSYNAMGRLAEAVAAYEKATALNLNDASLLADYADTLAVRNNRSLAGEPMKLVNKALRLEPTNIKALALAGSDAFDRKDYASAIRHWEKLVQTGPADNAMVQQMQAALEEARSLAGIPGSASGAQSPGAAQPPAAPSGILRGTLTLAPALKAQTRPDDTVFVFARAPSGSRMPLAILRKQVKDLPLAFTLDESMGMGGGKALRNGEQVIVGARVSRSGNAMPQAGDLTGQTAPVKVGSTNLRLEINAPYTP